MRLASYNVENLFARAKALNTLTWPEGQPALDAFNVFNTLANKATYSEPDKQDMLAALETLRFLVRTSAGNLRKNRWPFDETHGAWALLRENRGDFLKEPPSGDVSIVAMGRADWVGWVELVTEPVNEVTVAMTAKVIAEVAADVIGVVEAENRPSLVDFNAQRLNGHYAQAMLVDGNDPRGIDVGLMTVADVDIVSVRSHVDDPDPDAPGRPLFSRDCPAYELRTGSGETLWVLVNHLKSQSFTRGDPDPLRRRQSRQVRAIYDELIAAGAEHVAVIGDFNKGPTNTDPPLHPTLEALFGEGSTLQDASALPTFDSGPRPGTFQDCGLRNTLDYILLSPKLASKATGGAIFRKGLYGNPKNKKPSQKWEVYGEITQAVHGASDHAAVYVDLDI